MTDDHLADFERELHAAARRRAARGRSPRRWLAPAFAAAAVAAAVVLMLVLAAPAEREREVPAAPGPAGTEVELPALAPFAASGCTPRERRLQVDDHPLSILRRTQHPPDALSVDEVRFAAADYDPRATRSPTGIGERVVLSPTSGVGCDGDRPGVCLIALKGSRCFTIETIASGRAVVLAEPRVAIGIVPDGVESVALETAGGRFEATVVENAFRIELPSSPRSARVVLRGVPEEGCVPPPGMRRLVPVLDYPPPDGGVPPAIRKSFEGFDSPVIGRHARIWGGGDGVTYWVVPRLICDGAKENAICVIPLFEGEQDGGGGGSACATPSQLGRSWIHFPLRDGGAAVAGLAPEHASDVRVRIREAGFEQHFTVKDGVWGGTLRDYRPAGEVGGLLVEFDVPAGAPPKVAVLNGTTTAGLGRTVMDALEFVNYRKAENDVGDWSAQDVERTVVYQAPDQPGLGERIAIYLGEKFSAERPDVRGMTDEARVLGGEDADAVIVAGADLAG